MQILDGGNPVTCQARDCCKMSQIAFQLRLSLGTPLASQGGSHRLMAPGPGPGVANHSAPVGDHWGLFLRRGCDSMKHITIMAGIAAMLAVFGSIDNAAA